MSEDNTTESLPSEENVTPEGGEVNASQEGVSVADVLSKTLGREFKDDESALKAVKDTFNYVGKSGQEKKQLEQQIEDLRSKIDGGKESASDTVDLKNELNNLKTQLDETSFYAEKPELKPFQKLLSDLRGSTGKSLRDIAEDDAFKDIIKKAQAFDEQEKSKSVIHNNSRLGHATDRMTKAAEAVNKGDFKNAGVEATRAVMEAYGMKK